MTTQASQPAKEMTLIEHLEELRSRLFKMVLAFAIGATVAWFLYNPILKIFVDPLKRLDVANRILSNGRLIFTAPTEAFFVRMKVTAFAGLVLALPVILWQIWRFVTPALHKNEKRTALAFVSVSLALFAMGAAFALWSLPQALKILASFAGTELVLLPRATEYLSFVILLVSAFGLAFEFPLALLSLTLVGVLSSSSLRKARKISWIIILIAAAVITPTQDPITMLLLAVPLGILFEATILVARAMKR